MSAHLVWMDLEMTGLDPLKERIIEIATIITDGDLNTIAEGPVLAVRQPRRIVMAGVPIIHGIKQRLGLANCKHRAFGDGIQIAVGNNCRDLYDSLF